MKFLFLLLNIINILYTQAKFMVYDKCINDKHWALTYDDGPYIYDDALLDYLKSKNIKATFFVNGNTFLNIRSEQGRKIIKRMHAEGHNILNHTYTHINLVNYSAEEIIEDVTNLEDALEEIIGVRPALLRAPYTSGVYNETVQEILKGLNYSGIIKWNVDPEDWDKKGDIDYALGKFEGVVDKSSIITVNHNRYDDMTEKSLVNLAKAQVEFMEKHGYTAVTVSECIGVDPYKKISNTKEEKSSTSDTKKEDSKNEPKTNTNDTIENLDNETENKFNSTTNGIKPANGTYDESLPNSNFPEAQSSAISFLSSMHISSLFCLELLSVILVLCISNISL